MERTHFGKRGAARCWFLPDQWTSSVDERDYLALSLAIHSRVVEASKRRHWVTDDDIVIVEHVPEPEPEPLPEPIAPPVSGYPPRHRASWLCLS
jgi:hypothetical protein